MKLKSLLIGSAAAMVAATGARAADAIVIAEPEPMDYVRICDIYGAGFFYIPGTESCMRIGGYLRIEGYADHWGRDAYVRFAPTIWVNTDTEYGTLGVYGRIFADYIRGGRLNEGEPPGNFYASGAYLDQAFITLGDAFQVSLGKRETGNSQFFGYGGKTMSDGSFAYGYRNAAELRLSYDAGNGLSVFASAVEDVDHDWAPDAEFGARYDVPGYDLLWFGAGGTYDESSGGWTGKIAAEATIPNTPVTVKLMGHHYALRSSYNGTGARWSALGTVSIAATEMVSLQSTALYATNGRWFAAAGFTYTLHQGSHSGDYFHVRPEVWYSSFRRPAGQRWGGRIRFERGF